MTKKPVEHNQYWWEKELQHAWDVGFMWGCVCCAVLVLVLVLGTKANG